MQVRSATRTACIAYCFNFGVRRRVVMLADAVDATPKDRAAGIDHEGREWDTAVVDVLCGEGDRLLHKQWDAGRKINGHRILQTDRILDSTEN